MLGQLRPGDQLGRYVITGVLGAGAMGIVYAARDEHVGRSVAIKVMASNLAADPEFRDRFQREATALARLESPNVIHIFDHGEHDGSPWIAMQLVSAGDLEKLIERHGPLPPPLAVRVAEQVLAALSDAHRVGILHRDVKPSNVLVGGDLAREPRAYLCDFGISLLDSDATQSRITTNWDHLAPEVGRGGPASAASDIYAAGCLLWTCLTGGPVFPGAGVEVALAHQNQPPPTLPDHSPLGRHLNSILQRALAKEPGQRFVSADDFLTALRATPKAPGPTHTDSPRADSHRTDTGSRRVRFVAAAVAAVLLVGAGIGYAVTRPGSTEPNTPNADPSASTSASANVTDATSPAPEPVPGPVAGDFTGDGLGDFAISQTANPKAPSSIWASDGSKFTAPQQISLGTIQLSGDVNGDGTSDFINVRPNAQNKLEFNLRLGPWTPQTKVITTTQDFPDGLNGTPSIGDFNGDGKDDLAVVATAYGLTKQVWVGLSSGTGFGTITEWFRSNAAARIGVAGDFDGDGTDELAFVDERGIEVLVADSFGADTGFTSRGPRNNGINMIGAKAGDFDGDGTDELVNFNESYNRLTVATYVNEDWTTQSWGTFAPMKVGGDFIGTQFGALDKGDHGVAAVSDVNGDGRDDAVVIVGDRKQSRFSLSVLLSTGTSFEKPLAWAQFTCQCNGQFLPVGRWIPAS